MKRNPIKLLLLLFLLLSCLYADAQSWLPGYRYRKLITIEKSRVENDPTGFNQLINFNILLQLEHADYVFDEGAFEQKILHPRGLDIAFTLSTSSATVLKFQLDSYDGALGKIACWVKIPSVITKSSRVVSTAIYMYYGATIYHDPASAVAWSSWDPVYTYVSHLDQGAEGMIGFGTNFNGNKQMLSNTRIPAIFSFSVWIKRQNSNQEQMIIANDTAGIGGFQLKITSSGTLLLTGFNPSGSWTITSTTVLQPNEWCLVSLYHRAPVYELLFNGEAVNISVSSRQIAAGGQVSLGSSKQQLHYYHGLMDEIRISGQAITRQWILTEYNMITNPEALFTVGEEQVNAVLATAYTFTGAVDKDWLLADNWVPKGVPTAGKNIRIKAGVAVAVALNGELSVNKLLLERDAQLTLPNNLYAAQKVELQTGSTLKAGKSFTVQLSGPVLNHGTLLTEGKLLFNGNLTSLLYSGSGQASAAILEVDLPAAQASLNLQSLIKVSHSLNLRSGQVLANGNILLLATATQAAAVGPMGISARISGNVQVQTYVDGAFPEPATGRGWRLSTAPIWHSGTSGNYLYLINDVQQSVFITGKGGATNGFDPSPNNGATIYTHDQSLSGTLAQKYVPIVNLQTPIPVGRGFFIYSRGSRLLPEAFQHQVQTPPFSNAEPYTLTYKGQLFTGSLDVQVANRDADGEGDGFNLLGNPYAAPIRWGSLQKSNVGPFVWLFDPLNNTYLVSDDPETRIPAGAGFFIRVLKGAKTGSLRFSESAKAISAL